MLPGALTWMEIEAYFAKQNKSKTETARSVFYVESKKILKLME